MSTAFLKPIPLALSALLIGAGVFVWFNWFFSPAVPWPGGKTPADIRQEIEAKIDAIVNTKAPSLNVAGIDTSEWKTYQNLAYGFEFKLPPNYVSVGTGAMMFEMKYNPYDPTSQFAAEQEIGKSRVPSYISVYAWKGDIRNVVRVRTKSFTPKKVNTQNGIDYYREDSTASGCPLVSFLKFDSTLIEVRMNEVEEIICNINLPIVSSLRTRMKAEADKVCNINSHILDSFRIIKKEK